MLIHLTTYHRRNRVPLMSNKLHNGPLVNVKGDIKGNHIPGNTLPRVHRHRLHLTTKALKDGAKSTTLYPCEPRNNVLVLTRPLRVTNNRIKVKGHLHLRNTNLLLVDHLHNTPITRDHLPLVLVLLKGPRVKARGVEG